MAAKIIFAILLTVASQINADVAQLARDQKNLGPPPALPEDEGRSGLYTQTLEPQCYCQYGYSMCVTNPYDAAEVRCLLSCYKQAFPYLNLNDYEWICSGLPYRVPQVRRDNLDVPENNPQIPQDHDGPLEGIHYGPQAKTNSSIGPVDVTYKAPVNAPYRAPVDGLNKGPVNGPYKGPVDAPYRPPVNEPYKGPVDAPYRAPVNAPYRAPVDGAYKGPVNGPYKGPVDAPYRASVNEPYKGPVDGPYRGPADGPYRGPVYGAYRGTVDGPSRTRVDGPYSTPYRGPNNS